MTLIRMPDGTQQEIHLREPWRGLGAAYLQPARHFETQMLRVGLRMNIEASKLVLRLDHNPRTTEPPYRAWQYDPNQIFPELHNCNRGQRHWVAQQVPTTHPFIPEGEPTPWAQAVKPSTGYTYDPAGAIQPLLMSPYITNNGLFKHFGRKGFQKLLEQFNLTQAPVLLKLPEVWTFHRLTPLLGEKPIKERRRILGSVHGIWADTFGPISYLDDKIAAKVFQASNTNRTTLIIHAKNAHRIDKDIKYTAYMGPISDIKKPNRYALVGTDVLGHDILAANFSFIRTQIFVTAGTPLQQGLFGPHSRVTEWLKNLGTAISMPADLEIKAPKQVATTYQLPEALTRTHTYFKTQETQIVSRLRARGIFGNNLAYKLKDEANYLNNNDWKNMLLPRLIQRVTPSPTRQRILAVLKGKQQELSKAQADLEANKQKIEYCKNDIRAWKAEIQHLQAEITAAESSITVYEGQLTKTEKVIANLNLALEKLNDTLKQKHGGTEADIAEKVKKDKNLPDFFENWRKQNWLILDVKYRTKTKPHLTYSIKTKPEVAMDPNYYICHVECRTIKPHEIVVGATERHTYENRIGGPYHFYITRNGPKATVNVTMTAADATTILGIHKNTWNEMHASLHPHTRQTFFTNPNGLADFWQHQPTVCLGSAHGPLTMSLYDNDLNALLAILSSWMKNADPRDAWAQAYKWFPKVKDYPHLVATNDEILSNKDFIADINGKQKILKRIRVEGFGARLTLETIPLRFIAGEWHPSKKTFTKTITKDIPETYNKTLEFLTNKGFVELSLRELNASLQSEEQQE